MDKATIIARLVQNKANADQYSAFSEDNHSAIDAMIETVERGYTEDEVYRKFNTPYSQDAALAIIAVLNGEEEFEDVLFPERE